MSSELLPCPFCGGSVRQQGVDNVIKCDACGVTIDVPLSEKQEEAFEQGLVFDNWDIAHVARFWNTRAAAADEQFALAVHDGRAWEPVRTCMWVPFEDGEGHSIAGPGWRCSNCGIELGPENVFVVEECYCCPGCGAKVVE